MLIVDEVLAVGDSQFQKKCLGKMKDVSAEGRTVLFVSHDMNAVRMLCTRAAMFSKGQLMKIGPTSEIVTEYLARESVLTAPGQTVDLRNSRHQGSGAARFTELMFDAADGGDGPLISGGPLHAKCTLEAKETLVADSLSLTISDRTGYRLVHADTVRIGQPVTLHAGKNEIELRLRAAAVDRHVNARCHRRIHILLSRQSADLDPCSRGKCVHGNQSKAPVRSGSPKAGS